MLMNVALIVKYQAVGSLIARVRMATRPVPSVDADDHIRGDVNAVNTIIEYSDYQCRHCRTMHEEMRRLVAETGNTRWVIRHKPMTDMHPLALKAAVAAECAARQNAFWAYSDGLFEHQDLLSDAFFEQLAGERGLSITEFDTCRAAGVPAAVHKGMSQAEYLEIEGTPTFFVNGRRFAGVVPHSLLRQAISTH